MRLRMNLWQRRWPPRLRSLCVHAAEGEAHDYVALFDKKISDVPLDLVAAMVDGLHIVGLAGSIALVTLQYQIV